VTSVEPNALTTEGQALTITADPADKSTGVLYILGMHERSGVWFPLKSFVLDPEIRKSLRIIFPRSIHR
jgi:hypothetical protein